VTDVLGALLRRLGADESTTRHTKAAKIFSSNEGVTQGPEFLRIRALPRRRWQDDPDLEGLVDAQTARFKREGAEDANARLFPVQAVALAELELYRRLTAIVSVGGGKTLLAALIPGVLGAKRPLLLVPANLVEKSRREMKTLSKTWRVHPAIQIMSYEKLSIRQYKTFLQDGRYDVIVADEAFSIKTPDSGRTKRLMEYLDNNPDVQFVPMTGTPGDSTIRDYAHYFTAAGREHTPLPAPGSYELQQWTQALDEKTREIRRSTGCLSEFAGGNHELDAVRAGVGTRLEETPGFVYHRDASVSCSLVLDAWIHDDYSQAVEDVFEYVRESEDELPDGRVIDSPLERYNLFATMNLGFLRVIDPKPPEDWRAARKAYRSFVNECLDDDSLAFDTAGEVTHACREGSLDSFGLWEAWSEIEPTFRPISQTEWISTEIVEMLAEWMKKNDALVWTPFPSMGRALAKASGRHFFHRQGVSLTGGNIEAYTGTESGVVSTQSNYMGRNLQDRWGRNLVLGAPAKADTFEQLIGRTHRTGQKADVVEVKFFCGSVENLDALDRARGRARIDRDMGRNRSSKLLMCDWLCPSTVEVLAKHKGPRWRKIKT
jgi:hypothetical protein